MQTFCHLNSKTIKEASAALSKKGSVLNAGGTDLLGVLKDNILPDYPELIINLKTIPGLDEIREEDGGIVIGALTRLADIAASPLVQERGAALANAARSTASPHLREMATIGGNLCQLPRCWYFRKPDNIFPCLRKGGKECYAILGEHKFHSLFGAIGGCVAVNSSDIAPALGALDAEVITTHRTIPILEFFTVVNEKPFSNILLPDEIITEIKIPAQPKGSKSIFRKFAFRKSIDFPVVNCAIRICESPRIVLNAVSPIPVRAKEAELQLKSLLSNQKVAISEDLAEQIGMATVEKIHPLPNTVYKAQIAKTIVKRALLELLAR